MVESYVFQDGRITAAGEKASVFVFTAPTEEERKRLVEEFGIDHHELSSSLDPDELGRVAHEGTRTAIIMKRPRNYSASDHLLFLVASIGIFLTPKRLIIVASESVDLTDERIVHRVHDARDLLLRLLYGTIAHFLAHLRIINSLSEALEKRVNTSMGNRYLLDMFTLEKSLVYFVNGIGSNQAVIEKVRAGAARLKLNAAQREVLEEILIENQQCSKQAEIYSNILTGLMDARGSVVNNNLSVLMKRLTVISVIFMPMNVLAGMGGMSEFSSWTRNIPWWLAYSGFLLGLVPIGFLTYFILRSRNLDRGERRHRKAAARIWPVPSSAGRRA